MVNQATILILDIILIGLFVLIIIYNNNYVKKQEQVLETKKLEERINRITKKFFIEEDIDSKKRELKEIENIKLKISGEIRKKAETRAKKMKEILEKKIAEQKVLEQAGKLYTSFSIDLKEAMPRTDEERRRDMEELVTAISTLEEFDSAYYLQQKSKEKLKEDLHIQTNIGKAMFLDNVANKLNDYMKKSGLKNEPLFVYDKLISYGLGKIKNITRKDLLDVLPYMKEAGYIRDYIEINSQLYLVNQSKKSIEINNPEKVALSFIYEFDNLNIELLSDKAKWPKDYANSIVNSLIKKGLIKVENGLINIIGSETKEEKEKRIELENKINEKFKKKEEEIKKTDSSEISSEKNIQVQKDLEKEEIELEKEREIQEKKAEELKKKEKPKVKPLPLPTQKKISEVIEPKKEKLEKSIQTQSISTSEIILFDETLDSKTAKSENIELENKTKEIEQKYSQEPLQIPTTTGAPLDFTNDKELENLNFDDLIGKDLVEESKTSDFDKESIIQAILDIYEKYEHLNGGLMDLSFIHNLLSKLWPKIGLVDIIQVQDELKNLGFLKQTLEFENNTIWIFKDISLNQDMISIIKELTENGAQYKEELKTKLNWSDEKLISIIKELQELQVLNIDSQNKYYLPGIFTEESKEY